MTRKEKETKLVIQEKETCRGTLKQLQILVTVFYEPEEIGRENVVKDPSEEDENERIRSNKIENREEGMKIMK